MVLTALREIFVVGDAAAPSCDAGGLAIVVVHVDQVDVARHVEFARAELAHADDPQLGALAARAQRRAMARVELGAGLGAGRIERQFRQFGDARVVTTASGRLLVAVERDQAFQHQLAQHAQRGAARPGPGRAGPS